jgi:type I restriction enzyme S subunit
MNCQSAEFPKELDGANLTENAARIISQSTLPKYLCAYLSSPTTQDDIQGRIRSATLGKLSLLNIKDISVPIPTKEEQAEIVRILDSLLAKEQQAKGTAEAVLEKIDLLKKSILARAFRGELGTNDPAEESALELLKSVL